MNDGKKNRRSEYFSKHVKKLCSILFVFQLLLSNNSPNVYFTRNLFRMLWVLAERNQESVFETTTLLK